MMEYKGYLGKVEFDDEAELFHGEVVNIRDMITFQGNSVADLKKAFQDSVEDYLEFCKSRGEAPDQPFSGRFATRISPELHRQASYVALLEGKSLNAWVAEQLQAAVASFLETSHLTQSSKTTKTVSTPPRAKSKPGAGGSHVLSSNDPKNSR